MRLRSSGVQADTQVDFGFWRGGGAFALTSLQPR